MKLSRIGITVVVGMLLCVAGAFAQEKGSLTLTKNLTVQGKVLTPGSYKLQWEGKGPHVQLNIIRDNATVASVPATIAARTAPNRGNGYGSRQEADGSKILQVYFPDGKKFVLELSQNQAAKN